MRMRWGLGPVFYYEWLTASRRWQLYAVRALFVAILFGALALVWFSSLEGNEQPSRRMLARIGEGFFYAITSTELALVLLAAPAATAGSVCLDKARGTLLHLLVTDLSDAEIVLGKLAARLVPVLGLLLAALPVLFLGVLLGGIDPGALIGSYLVLLGVALFGCTLALTLSVWGTKTHEVLLATYGIWVVVLLTNPVWYIFASIWKTGPPPHWFLLVNPFYTAWAPYFSPGATSFEEPALFLASAVGLSMALALVAVARVRAVTVRQTNRPAREKRRSRWMVPLWNLTAWLPGPSLRGNPVLWREWRRKRPSLWVRLIWLVFATFALFFSVMAFILDEGSGIGLSIFGNALQVSVGFLLLSVGAVTVLAEERVRGSLDVLLTTPLSTWSIVWGKWWGAFRRVPALVVLPVVVAYWFAPKGDELTAALLMALLILGYGAAVTSLGLALAVWIPRFGRAVGLCVTAYVLATVAWPVVVFLFSEMSRVPNDMADGLVIGSPFFGPAMLIQKFNRVYGYRNTYSLHWEFFWIVFYFLLAAGLYVLVLGTFNRSMGRISKSQTSNRLKPSAY